MRPATVVLFPEIFLGHSPRYIEEEEEEEGVPVMFYYA